MPLPFTGTAIPVGASPPGFWNDFAGPIQTPVNYAGSIWLVGFPQDAPQTNGVSKSTDGGLTWTPNIQPSPNVVANNAVFDPIAGRMYFCGGDGANHLRVCFFDLNAETWSGNVDSAFLTKGHPIIARRPNGALRIFYSAPGAAPSGVNWVSFAGGAFGAPGVLDTGLNNEQLVATAACCDADGNFHVLYTSPSGGSGGAVTSIDVNDGGMFYEVDVDPTLNDEFQIVQGQNVSATGKVDAVDVNGTVLAVSVVFGGSGYTVAGGILTINTGPGGAFPLDPGDGTGLIVDILAIGGTTPNILYNSLSSADAVGSRRTALAGNRNALFGNSLVTAFGATFCLTQGDDDVAVGLIGSPLASPVWTPFQLGPSSPPTEDILACIVDAADIDGTIWFFYTRQNNDNPSTLVDVQRVRFDGAAASQELVWDILNDPPVGNPAFMETIGITASLSPTGVLQIGVNTTIDDSDDETVCYFAVPFDVAVQIWSIISGSLPPGLTLNPNTGKVSGTPTALGTFPFTVQVTSSSSVSDSPPNGIINIPYSTEFPAVFAAGETAEIETSITIRCPTNAQGVI